MGNQKTALVRGWDGFIGSYLVKILCHQFRLQGIYLFKLMEK